MFTNAAVVMAIVIQYCAGYNTAPVRDTRDPVGAISESAPTRIYPGPAVPPSAAAPLSPSEVAPLRPKLRSAPPSTPLRSALNSAPLRPQLRSAPPPTPLRRPPAGAQAPPPRPRTRRALATRGQLVDARSSRKQSELILYLISYPNVSMRGRLGLRCKISPERPESIASGTGPRTRRALAARGQ